MFDLLPEEMVVNILVFVDIDTLSNCRLVCKSWQQLIETNVLQEKASRENKIVNNGRGFYSFSQISSNDVVRLELPWFVFYVICKYDPFNRNLVKNREQYKWKHWKSINDLPFEYNLRFLINDHWPDEDLPQQALFFDGSDIDGNPVCFKSRRCPMFCTNSQNIRFKDFGLNRTIMKKLKPEIKFSALYNFVNNGSDVLSSYFLQGIFYNRSKNVVNPQRVWKLLIPNKKNLWNKISHTFITNGDETRMTLSHCIEDKRQNDYHVNKSFKISYSVVKFILPLKFKSAE